MILQATQCGQKFFFCEKHNKYMSSDECSLKQCFVIVKTHEKVET